MCTTLKELVSQTLLGKRIGPDGSSFRTNDAGLELSQKGREAIECIEHAIRSVVVPKILGDEIPEEFIGFKYLIGAYLVIGVRERMEGIFSFLKRQPKPVQIESLNCCSVFFFRTSHGYNFGVSPSDELIEYLSEMSQSLDPKISTLAQDVLNEHTYDRKLP